jgi:adenylosuccinate synthase
VAINGLDYLDYRNLGVLTYDELTVRAREFIDKLATVLRVPLTMLGTGPSIREIIHGKITRCRIESPQLISPQSVNYRNF